MSHEPNEGPRPHRKAVLSTLALCAAMSGACAPDAIDEWSGAGLEAGEEETYIVTYRGRTAPNVVEGTLLKDYPEIHVLIAKSAHQRFVALMSDQRSVEHVIATSQFLLPGPDAPAAAPPEPTIPIDPATVKAWQWDMEQIQLAEAHAVTTGGSDVLVANLDSGVDPTHPDLLPNLDYERSVSCLTG